MDSPDEQPEYIPLSYLNAYAYCPRRFYYEFTLGEMIVNEHVLAGRQFHERVDQPGSSTRGERVQLRRVYVCAPVLGVAGYCDVVEATGPPDDLVALAAAGRLYPVEYKKGKLGQWLNDHIQLCAQALALEEALGVGAGSIAQGYVFYIGSARRDAVLIDGELRARTRAALEAARRVAVLPQPPPPITQWRKCRDCSLEPLCLPREVLGLRDGSLTEETDGDSLPD
jgi:CRISPR-associated exonuclease Cas4